MDLQKSILWRNNEEGYAGIKEIYFILRRKYYFWMTVFKTTLLVCIYQR